MLMVVGIAGVVGIGEGLVRQILPDRIGGIMLAFGIFINSCAGE